MSGTCPAGQARSLSGMEGLNRPHSLPATPTTVAGRTGRVSAGPAPGRSAVLGLALRPRLTHSAELPQWQWQSSGGGGWSPLTSCPGSQTPLPGFSALATPRPHPPVWTFLHLQP